jgi:hypothetical protein
VIMLVAYPTAPVPSVINRILAPAEDRKSFKIRIRSPRDNEPWIQENGMFRIVRSSPMRLNVFFQDENTMLGHPLASSRM